VFPIFKNGSSSLYQTYNNLVPQDRIANLTEVDVFVRDPYRRFLSGAQTYMDNLILSNPKIDRYTVLQFINEYMFLNRHCIPQFHWLVNLARFSSARIKLLPLAELSTLTQLNSNKHNIDADVVKLIDNPKIQFYLGLDKVLTETLIGQTVTFRDILNNVDPDLYKETIEYSKNICSVLD
jgi:hypothetical protein